MTLKALLISGVNVFARGSHLVLFVFIGNLFGATGVTDAIFLFVAPVTVVMAVAAGAAEIVIMPTVHRAVEAGCPGAVRRRLLGYALMTVAPFSLIAVGVGLAIGSTIDWIIVALVLPMPVLAAASAVFQGFLNADGRFRTAVLGPAFGALAAVPLVLALPASGTALAIILLTYETARALGLRIALGRLAASEAGDPTAILLRAGKGAALQALGSLMIALNPMIDLLFARGLGEGAVTLVEYAGRLWNLVPLLFVGAFAIFHHRWSSAASNGRGNLRQVFRSAVVLGVIATALSVLAILLCPLVIDLVFQLGSMDSETRHRLGWLLGCYLVGAGPFVAGLVFVRAFSAYGQVRWITIAAAGGFLLNAGLDWLLIGLWGLNGIGLATSLTYLLVTVFFVAQWLRSADE